MPKNLLIYYSKSLFISYNTYSFTACLTGLTLGLGFYLSLITYPFSAISLTIKSVSKNLVTAGIGWPLLMKQDIPTRYSYLV